MSNEQLLCGTDLQDQLNRVKQPYYDIELAKISKWLKEYGYTMHVKLDGSVTLKKKGI